MASAEAKRTALAANATLLFAAVLAGASVVATRVAVQSVPPLSLAVMRHAQGGLILGVCLLLLARSQLRVRRQDLLTLTVLGTLLFAAFPLLFNAGLRLTEASRGSLMLATVPVWSALLARLSGQERLVTRQIIGLALATGGVAVAVTERGLDWQGHGSALVGDGLILLGVLGGAVLWYLYGFALSKLTPTQVAIYVNLNALSAMILATALLGDRI